MTAARDEDALTWGAETDPTHLDARVTGASADEEPAPARQTSSALLIVYGIFVGVFVLYIVGWILAIVQINEGGLPVDGVLPQIMYGLGEGLAIAAPLLWFFGVLLLTRRASVFVRILWLVLGLLVTAPWPFIIGIGGAQ